MAPMDRSSWNQWIELDRSAYEGNIWFFRRLLGDREISAVVKANAYGHGVEPIVSMALDAGVNSFAVHSLDEAAVLRSWGVSRDILILGYTPKSRLGEVVALGLGQVVYDRDSLAELNRQAAHQQRRARVHVKVETGTYRQGLEGAELHAFLGALADCSHCVPEGIYTHFANIEDTTRHDYALSQMTLFEDALETARSLGLSFSKVHSACSAASLLFSRTYGSMVRLGISQYGLWPSKETLLSFLMEHGREEADGLHPVLTWKCRVSQVKTVAAGRRVGYGGTYLTTRETKIAVLPVGYSDGYDRHLSNRGHVLIQGRRAPVRGRICMNLFMVDVTDIPGVQPEEEVVLLGGQGNDAVTADELAEMVGSINYEVVARIRPGIPRVVV